MIASAERNRRRAPRARIIVDPRERGENGAVLQWDLRETRTGGIEVEKGKKKRKGGKREKAEGGGVAVKFSRKMSKSRNAG